MSDNKKSDVHSLFLQSLEDNDIFTIGTTVDTGFELQAAEECKEKINKCVHVIKERGRIYFNIHRDLFKNVQEMRSIDNIFIIADVRTFQFNGADKEEDLKLFSEAVETDMHIGKSLNAWKDATGFPGNIYPTAEEYQSADNARKLCDNVVQSNCRNRKRGQDPSAAGENEVLRYRVTCERTGKHSFESGDVSKVIGGKLQDKFLWLVDLFSYHLEVVCKVIDNELITGLRVTHQSKHHRNITHFGSTTLRATICYNLLKLASPKAGDIIIDPMCGTGSIPVEGALTFLSSYILCGDNNHNALCKTTSNINSSASKSKIDSLQWSVTKLPLMDSSVDIIVTDMPFGKRSGKVTDNRTLYKELLMELGRVVKLAAGRVVLLTYDKRSLIKAVQFVCDLFKTTRMVGVNIGGLSAIVYVLKRTDISYEQFQLKLSKKKKSQNNQ